MTSRVKGKGHNITRISPCDLNSGRIVENVEAGTWNIESLKNNVLSDRYTQIVLLLTVIGLFLRFYNLGFNSLWLDEAVTYYYSTIPLDSLWELLRNGTEFNPPLFYVIESVMLYFGRDAIMLRIIPAFAGSVTIPIFYWLGKEFSDRNCGIICATLVTFSTFLVYYSQEARAYTLLLLFVALSILFFLKGTTNNRAIHWVLFGLFSGLAFWTHFYSAIVFGILVILGILNMYMKKEKRWENWKKFLYSLITFLLVTLPLLIVTVELFLVRTASLPTYGLQGWDVVTNGFFTLSGFSMPATVVFLILFSIGLLWAVIHEKIKCMFLAISIVAILIVSYSLSYRMPFETRFLIIMIPFYFLGIAYSSRAFCHIIKHKLVIFILIACIFLVNIPTLTGLYTVHTKENWRDFSSEFEQFTQDGDVVVLMPEYLHYPFNFYYDSQRDHTIQLGASSLNELENISKEYSGKRVFIIMTRDIFAPDPSGASVEWLKKNATLMGEYTGIFLFRISE
ncbi:MAG: glycosyltransferase family 39 protein [Methanolinea sp.]|jgi:uncharacterized membrane protein|nr:glycosyltransferase family 39 protein [Methanolinea sp.]